MHQETLETVPNIAAGYAVSDDGLTVTLELRPGTRWSNGDPFIVALMFVMEDMKWDDRVDPGWRAGETPTTAVSCFLSALALCDGKGGKYHKQDCEINAGYRMLERLRCDYPRIAAIIVADSLYSKQPCVEELTAKRFSFLLVAKPGDHKSLYENVDGLRRGNLLDRHHTVHRGERRVYEWVTGLPVVHDFRDGPRPDSTGRNSPSSEPNSDRGNRRLRPK